MNIPLPQFPRREANNAPGDFYVVEGICLRCCLPHGEAPGLLNDPDVEFEACFFRRQPSTPEEIQQAVNAIAVSDLQALRYGGTDPKIIAILCRRGLAELCDHAPEGQKYLRRWNEPVLQGINRYVDPVIGPPPRVGWWRRVSDVLWDFLIRWI